MSQTQCCPKCCWVRLRDVQNVAESDRIRRFMEESGQNLKLFTIIWYFMLTTRGIFLGERKDSYEKGTTSCEKVSTFCKKGNADILWAWKHVLPGGGLNCVVGAGVVVVVDVVVGLPKIEEGRIMSKTNKIFKYLTYLPVSLYKLMNFDWFFWH